MSNLSYNEKYAILNRRVIFADYIARKEINKQGNPLAINIGQPNNDASIMTYIRNGAVYTTADELTNYINQANVSLAPTPTVPGPPLSLCVIPSDSALTIIFLAGSTGGSPITNYEYSTDGITFTELSPAQNTSPLTISGLTNGSLYSIYLKAVNSIGASIASSVISATPIPSSFTPDSISGLNLWLDAQELTRVILSGSQVSAWNDGSSSANNFAAGPTGVIEYAKPGINGRPALKFTTADGTYLYKNMNLTPTNQLSLFMIINQTGLTSGNSELFFTKDSYLNFDLFNNTNPSQSGNLALNARSATQRDTGVDIITIPSINIISVLLDTTSGSVYVNGSVTSVDSTSFTGTSLNALHDWAISGGAFLGNVGEVIAYPSVLDDVDRQKVEAYLAWKWGLQDSLPNTNPWKTSPPTGDTPPGAPTLTYILGGDTIAYVYYTAGTGTVTNYQTTTDSGTTYTSVTPADTVTPVSLTGLTNDLTTSIQLRGYNSGGYSGISNSLPVTPSALTAPAAWLHFDPNNSSSYPGTGTTLSNIGTYGALNGNMTGSVSYITGTGITNKVFNFTGGYIGFGAFNFTNTFTVTAWIYPRFKASINAILANGQANINTPGFKMAWNNWNTSGEANRVLYLESGNSSGGNFGTPGTVSNVVTMNQWQHISLIFNNDDQVVIFLVNGIPVSALNITSGANIDVNRSAFNIGAYIGGTYTMNAELVSLKVFNCLLPASQVYDDFNATRATFGL
jgi:hypothetical protein